jgi:hypothetical protein
VSTIWLIRPGSWPLSFVPPTSVALVEVDFDDNNRLDALIAGKAIIITGEIHLGAALLRRCRWIRGIIGVGDKSYGIVDFAFAHKTGLQTQLIRCTEFNAIAFEQVLAAHQRMERHLRALDDIAEHWEGT